MASPVGPAIASVLVLGAVGGAVYAQASATQPPKKVAAVQAPLSCQVEPTAPGGVAPDPTNLNPLVPPLAAQAIVCSYSPTGDLLPSPGLIDPVGTATLSYELDSSATDPLGATGAPATCGAVSATAPVSFVILRYGLRPDVTVKIVSTAGCGLYASTGGAGAIVNDPDLAATLHLS